MPRNGNSRLWRPNNRQKDRHLLRKQPKFGRPRAYCFGDGQWIRGDREVRVVERRYELANGTSRGIGRAERPNCVASGDDTEATSHQYRCAEIVG